MSIEAIKEALASMCRAASMHDSEWTHRMGEVNDWGTQCWEIDGERVQELATAYGETTAAFIAACNPAAIRSLIERLEAAEKDAERYRQLRDKASMGTVHIATPDGAIHYGSGADEAVDSAMGLSPAKSAGELQAADSSPQVPAPERLHPLHDPRPDAGLVSGGVPFGVPPTGMEHQGNDASPGHKFNGGGQAGGSGVSGGLEAGRSGHGGVAEGVAQ